MIYVSLIHIQRNVIAFIYVVLPMAWPGCQDKYDVIGNIMTRSSNRLKFQFNQCCLRLTMDVLM